MATRQEVYAAINGERDYQDSKRYETYDGTGGGHTTEEFILYMEDYIAEARQAATRTWGTACKPKMLDIVRKVTALGVACMEENGVVERVVHTAQCEDTDREVEIRGFDLDRSPAAVGRIPAMGD